MKITTKDFVWIVVDPTPTSVIEDLYFQTTLVGLRDYLHGMLASDIIGRNVTVYKDEHIAKADAWARLKLRDKGDK